MKVTAKDVAEKCTLLAGARGLRREVRSPVISRPDLASPESLRTIASSLVHLPPGQLRKLASLRRSGRLQAVQALMRQKPAALVVSGGVLPPEMIRAANASRLPVLRSRNVPQLARFLMERISPVTSLHGVLVQIFGLGTLIIGESAIGKSEAALDLVLRGHKLIADDIVVLEKTKEGISGHATGLGADLLQIRGLGVINIRSLYGESATATACSIGLVVELEEWKKGHHYTLVGLRERRYRLFGASMPYLKLPVKTGRNIATLIEVAARNQMLKNRGEYTARDLQRKLMKRLQG